MNARNLLNKQALNFGSKPALIFNEHILSFQGLRDASFAVANYLLKAGFGKDDKVAVFSPDTPAALVSILGVMSIGAVLVPLDFMLSEEEIVEFINHSEAKVLFAHFRKGVKLSRVKSRCPSLEKIVVWNRKTDTFSHWQELLDRFDHSAPDFQEDGESTAAILYTSGSTGEPKGVVLSYNNLDNPSESADYFLKLSDKDILFCGGVPFSHIGGLDYILLMLNFGSTLVLNERFHPYEFLKTAQKYKATLFWIVPSMYTAIMSLKKYEKFNLSSLRYAIVFGAPSSPALLRRFHKICPNARLLNGWGMTETSAPNCVMADGTDKLESVGRFYPETQAKIVNGDGKSLGPNQNGELWVRGKGIMKGYFKSPSLTKEVLTDDGWLKTGDIAYYDEDNLFYITGRIKDMIKVGGEVVFSPEVEEKICYHPKVREAAVIGAKDKLRGEIPRAFIVVKEGERLEEKELRDFLRSRLAHFKIPHRFEFVQELPKTRTGKIDKKALVTS